MKSTGDAIRASHDFGNQLMEGRGISAGTLRMAHESLPLRQLVVPQADHDLTLVIPAYNEEGRLPWTLTRVAQVLQGWGVDYRVIVADDGSSDSTPRLTEGMGPRFRTVSLPSNGGKGKAIREAMLRATGRVVAFTDADLPFDLDALLRGYQWIDDGQCEVVFGARDLVESNPRVTPRWIRRMATRCFRGIVGRLVSGDVADTQCGLKLFSRRAALEIFARTTINGFAFDVEVVSLTQRLGLAYRRLPVVLVNDYGSTLSVRGNVAPMLRDVVKVWWNARRCPAAAPLAIRFEGQPATCVPAA